MDLGKKSLLTLSTAAFFFSADKIAAQETPQDTISSKNIEEVVILGNRGGARSRTDSPVPVDVFNVKNMSVALPQSTITQMLNVAAPSFTSTIQTNADGTDHLDPAQLRGLGPDQVLVLINGKRRHTSALVNVNGTPGRGTIGTDLNAIPSFALSRIEVLRDGAAAQYGSDAIAGVMNLELKREQNGKINGQVSYGANATGSANDHTGGTDGQTVQVDMNYGNKIGRKSGFYNITASMQYREPTYRAGTESGTLFNAYNAIEWRASENGVNLSSMFSNIGQVSDPAQLLSTIKTYAPKVGYFSPDLQTKIAAATTISQLQGLLNGDFTNDELAYRRLDRKSFNMQVGQSKLLNAQLFLNAEIPLDDNWKIYTFGGYSHRHGSSGGFYRKPNQSRTFTGIYLNGFLPKIITDIDDQSLSAGVKGKIGRWTVDFSDAFGRNNFAYTIANTGNTSLRFASPDTFDAGGLRFSQNTVNLDVSADYEFLQGVSVGLGAEHRFENFKITEGEPASYLAYDIYGNPRTAASVNPTDFFGNSLPGGSQVFAGFRTDNAVNKNRQSVAGYADVQVNLNDRWLADAAVRYEHYSDFGGTFNYKLATRYKISKYLNVRAAGSTGFRAPSIHQIYYNTTSTQFLNGQLYEVGTFSNDSKVAELLGIPKLKQETSKSVSAGFTYRIPSGGLSLTADAYFVRIDNRIVLTDQFRRPGAAGDLKNAFDAAAVDAAQLFSNAINTESRGLDVVVSYNLRAATVQLNNSFALNLSRTKRVGDINASALLQSSGLASTYFSERSRVYTEEAVPRVKAGLSHDLSWNGFSLYLRNSYYGEVTGADGLLVNGKLDPFAHQIMEDKVITDLSLGYRIAPTVTLTVGANNLFDVYPSKNLPENANNDQFVYTRSTSQFGLNGRYLFGRITFDL